MSTSTDDNEKKVAQSRETEVERLNVLRQFPRELPAEDKGVLLSDRIRYYCEKFQLVDPFSPKLLRPAGYVLTVGANYSVRGERKALNESTGPLEIRPYEVAIIETYETINMPEFLIGRWNIRIKLAYKGLLWVGGAQVDPGFRGHLCCPIYNLSTNPVPLDFRDGLAAIDFVATTPYKEGESQRFPWRTRDMLIFPEYPLLDSGIKGKVSQFEETIKNNQTATDTKVTDAKAKAEESIRGIQHRIDNFVSLTFGVVALLFAGLTVVATKPQPETFLLDPPVWLAALPFWFALRAQPGFRREGTTKQRRYSWLVPAVTALLALGITWSASLFFEQHHAAVSAKELQQANSQAEQAKELAVKATTAVDCLQQQIKLLQQNQSKAK